EAGTRLSLTLSDAFCVDRWRNEFRELVSNEVDILFANESEILSLYQITDFDEAVVRVREDVELAVLTRGPRGSVIVRGDEVHVIDPVRPARVLDTTGAGDLYAAGFLHALCRGHDLDVCGRLGSHAASRVIAQYGARPEQSMADLLEKVSG
ncbi:MAG: adenosine kinase, partial [Geminicoccaceae bacterium]|nr:adenosine kinase [Geminicoccaceae bacterium]